MNSNANQTLLQFKKTCNQAVDFPFLKTFFNLPQIKKNQARTLFALIKLFSKLRFFLRAV